MSKSKVEKKRQCPEDFAKQENTKRFKTENSTSSTPFSQFIPGFKQRALGIGQSKQIPAPSSTPLHPEPLPLSRLVDRPSIHSGLQDKQYSRPQIKDSPNTFSPTKEKPYFSSQKKDKLYSPSLPEETSDMEFSPSGPDSPYSPSRPDSPYIPALSEANPHYKLSPKEKTPLQLFLKEKLVHQPLSEEKLEGSNTVDEPSIRESSKNFYPNYNVYLEVAQGKRPSTTDQNRLVEKNILYKYGVISSKIYNDVYEAALTYTQICCKLGGIYNKGTNNKRTVNLGCAVLYDRSTDTRKLLLIFSGIKSFSRFADTYISFNENLHKAFQEKDHPLADLKKKLTKKDRFTEILHYTDCLSPEFHNFMKNLSKLHSEGGYSCSEPILFDECEKFCAENPQNHIIEGTVEFRVVIKKIQNTPTLVFFRPQQSCVDCELHADKNYYEKTRNRSDLSLSLPRARPLGESFASRKAYYSERIVDFDMGIKESNKQSINIEAEKNALEVKLTHLYKLRQNHQKKLEEIKQQMEMTKIQITELNKLISELLSRKLDEHIILMEKKIYSDEENIAELEIQLKEIKEAREATRQLQLIKETYSQNLEALNQQEIEIHNSINKDEIEKFNLTLEYTEINYEIKCLTDKIKLIKNEITRWKEVNTNDGILYLSSLNTKLKIFEAQLEELTQKSEEYSLNLKEIQSKISDKKQDLSILKKNNEEERNTQREYYLVEREPLQSKAKFYNENKTLYSEYSNRKKQIIDNKQRHSNTLERLKKKMNELRDHQKAEVLLKQSMTNLIQEYNNLESNLEETKHDIESLEQKKEELINAIKEQKLQSDKFKFFEKNLQNRIANIDFVIRKGKESNPPEKSKI